MNISTTAVCLVVLATGCARSRPSPTSPQKESKAGAEICVPAALLSESVSVSGLLDSLTLMQRIGSSTGPDSAGLLLSLFFDNEGSLARLGLLESKVWPDSGQAVRAAIAGLARPQQAGAPFAVRLRLAGGQSPRLVLERSLYCPPRPLGPFGVQRRRITSEDVEDLRHAGPFILHLLVGTNGHVQQVALTRSSGSRFQDNLALENAKSMRFEPARLDGVAIEAWYEINSAHP